MTTFETRKMPEITRALIKQTREGYRVDEVSVSITESDTGPVISIAGLIAKTHTEAQFECDRLNTRRSDTDD